jgi:tetratricopeptide (TPR) repeat protein
VGNQGLVLKALGDYEAAWLLQEESHSVARETGYKMGVAFTLGGLGRIALCRGDVAGARDLLRESLSARKELTRCDMIAPGLKDLGDVAFAEGDYAAAQALYEEARALYEESIRILSEQSLKGELANLLTVLGSTHQVQGDPLRARALYAEAIDFFREEFSCGVQWPTLDGAADCLEGIAGWGVAQGGSSQAVRLLGAAARLRDTSGAVLPPYQRSEYERRVAALRNALGENAFSAAWAEGWAAPKEQTVITAGALLVLP